MPDCGAQVRHLVAGVNDPVASARDYLASAELVDCTVDQFAAHAGLPSRTVQYRLKAAGTSWLELKNQERAQRLRLCRSVGRISIPRVAHSCGFSGTDAFLRFFKRVMGKTFTEYRLARQQEVTL